jgi:HSP20 family molecular chaperone IbpA|tara:strand:- start:2084 stop:2599 length:516 start_codon:yes stop_codon:yes gene_type:complete
MFENLIKQPQMFDSLIDQMNSLFFNYNSNYKEFMEHTPKELMKLPFYKFDNEILYYGGDYIICSDPKDSKHKNYIFYFIIPGHDESTIEINRVNDKLIIKTKDYDKDVVVMGKNPFNTEGSVYNFYKVVNLIKHSFEVKEAVCKNGILTILVTDTDKEAEKQVIKVKNTYS